MKTKFPLAMFLLAVAVALGTSALMAACPCCKSACKGSFSSVDVGALKQTLADARSQLAAVDGVVQVAQSQLDGVNGTLSTARTDLASAIANEKTLRLAAQALEQEILGAHPYDSAFGRALKALEIAKANLAKERRRVLAAPADSANTTLEAALAADRPYHDAVKAVRTARQQYDQQRRKILAVDPDWQETSAALREVVKLQHDLQDDATRIAIGEKLSASGAMRDTQDVRAAAAAKVALLERIVAKFEQMVPGSTVPETAPQTSEPSPGETLSTNSTD